MSDNRMTIPVSLGEMGAPVLQYLCDELVALMRENNAPNFMGLQMQHKNGDWWMLTIQRVNGETPEAQCRRLREELAALKQAALAVVKFWEGSKAAFAEADVAMPAGVSVDPVLSEQWADIKGRDLDELARLASGKECAQHTPAAYSPATEEPEEE